MLPEGLRECRMRFFWKRDPSGNCIQCGKEEDAVYLYAHGGLCKRCAEAKPILVCPDCGGKLRPAPGLYPVGEVEFECADCGKKVKL